MTVLQEVLIENTPEAWTRRAETGISSADAAGWSEQGQAARFKAVHDFLDFKPGDRLLDYGCGTGLFSTRVPPFVDYVGYDSSRGMIDRAVRDHGVGSHRLFQTWEPVMSKVDLIVCIGVFNLPDRWSKQHTWHTLRHLWATYSPRTLVASLYAGTDERCLCYEVDETEQAGRTLTYAANVVGGYLPNDLMLVASR